VEPFRADRYKVVRVPFRTASPRSYSRICDRLLGFGRAARRGLGPPSALAIAKDGSLLVADDTGWTIRRIAYRAHPSGRGRRAGANLRRLRDYRRLAEHHTEGYGKRFSKRHSMKKPGE